MGPWSILAAGWLRLPAVFGLKGHSIVFDTGPAIPAEAAFLEYREAPARCWDRSCSHARTARPMSARFRARARCRSTRPRWRPTPARSNACMRSARTFLRCSPRPRCLRQQACFRPIARDGLPLIGRVPGLMNAYVATGHSVWGILNAPATGEAMAELIADGRARSVDLSPFDPARLPPLDPAACAAPASCNRRSAYPGFIGGNKSSASRPSSYSPMLWRQKSAGGGWICAMRAVAEQLFEARPLEDPVRAAESQRRRA